MKKLISAVTSLCMAATMVSAVVPATVGAADATKGFSIKTYDDTKPGISNGASEVTIKKADIGANGYNIPAAVYLTEGTDNDTGSLSVAVTTDSPDLKFAVRLPDQKYYDSEKNVTLSSGSGSTDQYITFGGIMDDMDGYMAPGRYIFGCEPSMTAAGAENYFIGLSWMNDGRDYKWAGTKSDDYPLYAFDITVPANIAAGTYHVDFHHYDTDPDEKVTVMSPMIEARKENPSDTSRKYSLEENNLTTSGLTIKIEGDGTEVTTTTTAPNPTTTTTTTTTPVPVGNKDFNFKIVDGNGNSTANAAAGEELTLNLVVNAGNNTCAGMDAQYDLGGLELVQMGKKAKALGGATINTNEAEARISIMSVGSGDGEPSAVTNGESVSVIKVKVPANAAEGTQYTVDLVSSELKVFKEGGSGDKYTAGVTPFVVQVGNGIITTTTKDPNPSTTTTTVDPNAQFKFKIVDADGNSAADVTAGQEVTLSLVVDAGTNTCAGMDAQYDLGGLELVQMGKKAKALGGATINTNEAEARISIMSVGSGDGEPSAVTNGESVSVIKVKVPANATNGTKYTVDLVKSELKVFKEGGSGDKYSAAVTPIVLTVNDGTVLPTTTTSTTTTPPGPTTTTTVDPNAQFKFKIVDGNGNSTANAEAGAELTLSLVVDAGTNTCAGMDAQYDLGGLELVQMGKKAKALGGATINTNEDEARISIMSVGSGDGEPSAVTNGESVSVIKVKVPANAANGTKYTVDLVKSELKVFKEGGSGDKYSAAVTPFVLTIGSDVTTTTTTSETTTTTTTTTTTPDPTTTTTTTTPPAGKLAPTWGDVNCDGKVNVADVVVLNRYLNDPTYPVSDQGKVNGDVKDPQDKSGAAVDPAGVKLTAADSETILKSIVDLVTLPQ
ncbi:dockerin type I repeat-containing protein [uncultured Ruminococcus sp.]|uniref:dockerin type I repeat-containing protein n=1 Tax=uncultured Ruminococcus sp. TaxID=165186 RepID=UPI0026119A02|nr:dockerin type I repeat-containing protein [uncultured Ruminococcus sp.]